MQERRGLATKEGTMGTVEKIFILHGWTYSTDRWEQFLNLLAKEGFKPILLKIPGLTEKINRVWDMDDYVDWLKKKIGEDKAILIGHSSGGRMSLVFALKYPEKVKHLILMDSAGIYHKESFIRIKRFLFRKMAKWGKKISDSKSLRDLLYKFTGEADYRLAAPTMRETMKNLISIDLTDRLSQIKIPTLIIWGEFDKTTPAFDGRLMHKLIPNSKFHIIKSAKHSPMFTHPREAVKRIVEELKK